VILPDVNVLVYAFRRDADRHAACRAWLDELVNGDEAYGMAPQVLASFVRIVTHPRVYVHPSSLREALEFSAAVLEPEHCTSVRAGARHWEIFTGLCERARVTGNLVQDAWFAALAIESGADWVTFDRDYARFPGLRWREPF